MVGRYGRSISFRLNIDDILKGQEIVQFGKGHANEFSACPVIRYIKPYYYVIYVHGLMKGHNGYTPFLSRSKDLENWEQTPFNPIMEAGKGEGCNNYDNEI